MKYDEKFKRVLGMLRDGSLSVASIAKAVGMGQAYVKHVRMVKDMPSLLAHMQNDEGKEIPEKLVVALDTTLAQSATAYEELWATWVRGEWKPARAVRAAGVRPGVRLFEYRTKDSLSDVGTATVVVLAVSKGSARSRLKGHVEALGQSGLSWELRSERECPTAGIVYSNVERR